METARQDSLAVIGPVGWPTVPVAAGEQPKRAVVRPDFIVGYHRQAELELVDRAARPLTAGTRRPTTRPIPRNIRPSHTTVKGWAEAGLGKHAAPRSQTALPLYAHVRLD